MSDPHVRNMGFMAEPGTVADWRYVVLADAAVQAGLLDALPATPAQAAAKLDLDPHAVRVVLGALREWDVVEVEEGSDRYLAGPTAVSGETADVLAFHARVIRRWSTSASDRLRGALPETEGRNPGQREQWIRTLAAGARTPAAAVADVALQRFPGARRILDLAGGHGEYGMAFASRGLDVTMQDLPDMVEIVREWPSIRDSGVRLFASDVFEQLPEGPFDLVVCSGFTHTQPAERIASLFPRLHAITAPGGGIAVRTLMRDQRPTGPIFAVQMLMGAGRGDTHGYDEYRSWLTAAGYVEPELADTGPGERSLILAGT